MIWCARYLAQEAIGLSLGLEPPEERALGVGEPAASEAESVIRPHDSFTDRAAPTPTPMTDTK